MNNEESRNLCCYTTTATLQFLIYLPSVAMSWVLLTRTPTAEDVLIPILLTGLVVLIHFLCIPCLCFRSDAPSDLYRVGLLLGVQLLPLLVHMFGGIYYLVMAATYRGNQETKQLYLDTGVVMVLTILVSLALPCVVSFISAVSCQWNAACRECCAAARHRWRVRRALDTADYNPINTI